MNRQVRMGVGIVIIAVIFGWLFVTTPQERLLYSEEYTPLEFSPSYYYANFMVADSDSNAKLSFDIDIDRGENYTDSITLWVLYNLPLVQFEESFNLTEVRDEMAAPNWDVDDLSAIWAGWFAGETFFPFWEPVSSGEYVLVFWIEPDGPTLEWSATLTVSLQTSILSLT